MKAVTVRQPYASLISVGLKTYEFRNLNTKYRGPIYIHAAVQSFNDKLYLATKYHLDCPHAVIVAKANLADCIPNNEKLQQKLKQSNHLIYGSNCHKYAWVLTDIKPINSKTIVKGQLGIWNIKDESLIKELI